MSIVAGDLLGAIAAHRLHDATNQRWTKAMLYHFLSQAQTTLVTLRPDTNVRIVTVQLTAGSTQQSIPAGGHQLLDVIRNMGVDGLTPGDVITVTDRASIDSANKDWHNAAGSNTIYNFVFDDRVPHQYFVTPPAGSTCYVEIKYSKLPARITSDADILEVSDAYEEALASHVMHSCMNVQIDSAQDRQAAKQWLANFFLLIGQTASATALLSPNNTTNNTTVNVQGQANG